MRHLHFIIHHDSGTYTGAGSGLVDASECLPCTQGHWCPAGSVNPTACVPGTYNPDASSGSITNCVPCDAGYACPNYGMTSMTTPCSQGHYCSTGTVNADDNGCPAGTYTDDTDLIHWNGCLTCPGRKGKRYKCTESLNAKPY